MSCDNNRTRYFEHVVAGAGARAGVAAGDLEGLYQANRGTPPDRLAAITAAAKTRQLFGVMQQAGFPPPTHAADGLPKTESQPGYAAVYDYLKGRGWIGVGSSSTTVSTNRVSELRQSAGPSTSLPGRHAPAYSASVVAAAKTALAGYGDMVELAVDDTGFMSGGDYADYYALHAAAQAVAADPTAPAEARQVAIAFQSNVRGYVKQWAGAVCAMAGLNRCPQCQRFSSPEVAHVCPTPQATYDRNGYDRQGYNREGRNKEGLDRNGRDREGYDNLGFKQGYNRHGYDRNGIDRRGMAIDGYNRHGLDAQGYNRQGYKQTGTRWEDQEGYDLDGYDAQGYDRNGYTRDARDRTGQRHPMFTPDANGVYGDGLDAWGCGPDGYDPQGRDRYGFDRNGYNAAGFDRNGYNAQGLDGAGCDRDGYNAQGFKLGADGVLRNRAGFDIQGFDASGYSWTGFDRHGKDRNGAERTTKDRKGNVIPARFNLSGWDKDGVDRWGYGRKTGLTLPDANGIQRNVWGWTYDPVTHECFDPADPTSRVPHTEQSWYWDKYGARAHTVVRNGVATPVRGLVSPRVTVYTREDCQPHAQPSPAQVAPPITPFAAMTPEAYRRTLGHLNDQGKAQTDARARHEYALIQQPRPEQRWTTARAHVDAKAAHGGILLKCPQCGQFTGGNAHACPAHPDYPSGVRIAANGVVLAGEVVVYDPRNPHYHGRYSEGGYAADGYDAGGYDRRGFNRNGLDRDGYTMEGYDVFGFDRQGYTREGYNRSGKDRDGNEKPKTLAEAARGLDDNVNPLSTKALADMYSRLASGLTGRSCQVTLKPGALHVNTETGEQVYITSGFATNMQGKIQADPTPLGSTANPRDNLVVTRAGIYHELGHELYTDPGLWATCLEANTSTTPYELETIGGGTLVLDAGRRFLPQIYNIVEDGRMEREVARNTPGAGEILAASCRLEDRWGWEPGRPQDDYNDLTGALLYEALPFYKVRPEVVEERLSPKARALFEELRPLVQRSVRGSGDDAFNAAVIIAKRLEEEGIIDHDGAKKRGMTPPPPPPPGTQARRPKITIDGDQVIDAGQQQGGGGGGMAMDVEYTGHVTIKHADQIDDQGGGGSATFSGGVTYEGGQPKDQQQPGGQQNGQQGGQQGQQGGQSGGESGEQHSVGQSGGQSGGEHGGSGGRGRGGAGDEDEPKAGWRGRGSASDDDAPKGRRPAAADDETTSGGSRGRTGTADEESTGSHGGGTSDDDARKGRQPGAEDEPGGSGGGRAGAGDDQDDDAAGQGGGGAGAGEDVDDEAGQGAGGGRGADARDDVDPWGDGDDGGDDDDTVDDGDGEFTDDGGAVSGSTGQAGRGGGFSGGQGGSGQLRDWDSPFTEQQVQDAVSAAEAQAAAAIEEGVRAAATPEAMGRDLHRPLGDSQRAKQRYKTADGRVETVSVAQPKSDNAPLKEKLERRRPKHKQIARDLAKQLKAIREQTEQRLRFQKQGRIDRRRFVAAVKGAEDVRTQIKELPATAFAASIAVDLSGSMHTLIQNGSLFDATMILSDTFEDMNIAHEVRGFGSDAAQFRSMGDTQFDPDRAAMLASGDRGGTTLAGTAGLATQALRGRDEGNKLFVALSDGSLGDHPQSVTLLKEARRNGVVTFGIFLGGGAPTQQMDELYGPGNWVQINDLKDFPVSVGRRISQIFKQMR